MCVFARCMKKYPIVTNMKPFESLEQTCVIQGIVALAEDFNWDVEVEDFAELKDYTDGELTNENLVELEEHLQEVEEERTEEVQKKFMG